MSVSRLLSEDTIRQVAAASDIAEVAGAYLPLKKTGATFAALCPVHQEKSPSFTITPARQSFKCFGCGVGGDVFRLVSLIENVGFRGAVLILAHRAGIVVDGASRSTGIPVDLKPVPKSVATAKPAKPLRLPTDLHQGTQAELRAVAERRGLSVAGLELASERGLIRFGEVCRVPCWLVIDSARVVAQARRMDGTIFPAFGEVHERKAHTLKGSQQAWTIGAREADEFSFLALVEGGPDLLAAHHFITAEGRENDAAVVAMLGAANDIPKAALPLLAHKRVRIYPHRDESGQAAAARWTGQLESVACEVDAFRFEGLRRADGGAVCDLNDLANLGVDDYEAEQADLMEVLPR